MQTLRMANRVSRDWHIAGVCCHHFLGSHYVFVIASIAPVRTRSCLERLCGCSHGAQGWHRGMLRQFVSWSSLQSTTGVGTPKGRRASSASAGGKAECARPSGPCQTCMSG